MDRYTGVLMTWVLIEDQVSPLRDLRPCMPIHMVTYHVHYTHLLKYAQNGATDVM